MVVIFFSQQLKQHRLDGLETEGHEGLSEATSLDSTHRHKFFAELVWNSHQ